jgi:hypothetical protein
MFHNRSKGENSLIGESMAWLEVALQNPAENWPVWLVLLIALINVVNMLVKLANTLSNNSAQVQLGYQGTIAQENTHQSRLMDEMAAWRESFNRRDDKQIKINEDQQQTNKRMMDLYEERIIRIDKNTSATHGDARTLLTNMEDLQKQTRLTQYALKTIYQQLKKEGILQ